jgi:hypothetical protein
LTEGARRLARAVHLGREPLELRSNQRLVELLTPLGGAAIVAGSGRAGNRSDGKNAQETNSDDHGSSPR